MPHLTNKELEARLTKQVIYQAIRHGINVVSVNGNLAIKENLTEYKYIFDTPKGLLVCTFDAFNNGSEIYNAISRMLLIGPTYTEHDRREAQSLASEVSKPSEQRSASVGERQMFAES